MHRTTINDVAKHANVSKSVVSVVFSHRNSTVRVSEAVRARVLAAAEEIDYHPNPMAKSLNFRKSFLIAFLCTGGGAWSISTRMLRSLHTACRARGYSLVVYPSDSLEDERINLLAARDRMVDGIIATPYLAERESNAEKYGELVKEGMPIIQLNPICPDLPGVCRDNRTMGREAVEKLIGLGHKRIGFLTYSNYVDPVTGPESHTQFAGYTEAMLAAGLEPYALPVDIRFKKGASPWEYKISVIDSNLSMAEMLKEFRPTAVISSTNSLAYSMALGCGERGIRIPEDLSVISCSDDYILPETLLPSFAGFPLAAERIGEKALELCLSPNPEGVIYIHQDFRPGGSLAKYKKRKDLK